MFTSLTLFASWFCFGAGLNTTQVIEICSSSYATLCFLQHQHGMAILLPNGEMVITSHVINVLLSLSIVSRGE